MLWVTLLMSFLLTIFYEVGTLRSIVLFAVAILTAVAANVLRVLSLFYVEAGLIEMPQWGHSAVGVSCFLFIVAMMVLYANAFVFRRGMETCVR